MSKARAAHVTSCRELEIFRIKEALQRAEELSDDVAARLSKEFSEVARPQAISHG
jgi:hypothetical protein